MTRYLRIVQSDTGEVIHTVDVSGSTDRQVERCMLGMLCNLRDDCHIEDSDDDGDDDDE